MATVGQLTADKKALDPRTIVENEEAIGNITQAYVGLLIYNKEDGKLYKVTEINSLSGKILNKVVLPPSSIGAQPEINNSNKLNADNIADGTINKVVTQAEKDIWDGKQDALTTEQLSNITKGGTALQPSSTSGLLKNDGTVDTETQSKAANAIQTPSATENDKIPVMRNGNIMWESKPSDGLSAFELAKQQGYQGDDINEWLSSLKATIGAFKFVDTDLTALSSFNSIGDSYNGTIDGVTANANTKTTVLLMNDANPATKTMMITTEDDGNSGYQFVYAGDLQSAIPSNVLIETRIDNTALANPVSNALAKAGDVMKLAAKLEGVTAVEDKAPTDNQISGYINGDGAPVSVSAGSTSTYVVIPLNNAKGVRLLGSTNSGTGTNYTSYAFWNAATYVDSNTVVEAHNWDVREGSVNYAKEYKLNVPEGATHIAVSLSTPTNQPNFYCYLQSGESIGEMIDKVKYGADIVKLIPDTYGEYIGTDGLIKYNKNTGIKHVELKKGQKIVARLQRAANINKALCSKFTPNNSESYLVGAVSALSSTNGEKLLFEAPADGVLDLSFTYTLDNYYRIVDDLDLSNEKGNILFPISKFGCNSIGYQGEYLNQQLYNVVNAQDYIAIIYKIPFELYNVRLLFNPINNSYSIVRVVGFKNKKLIKNVTASGSIKYTDVFGNTCVLLSASINDGSIDEAGFVFSKNAGYEEEDYAAFGLENKYCDLEKFSAISNVPRLIFENYYPVGTIISYQRRGNYKIVKDKPANTWGDANTLVPISLIDTTNIPLESSMAEIANVMNVISANVGATNSNWKNPYGGRLYSVEQAYNRTTAKDMVRLMIAATKYPELIATMGTEIANVHIFGEHDRDKTLKNNSWDKLNDAYTFLHGSDSVMPYSIVCVKPGATYASDNTDSRGNVGYATGLDGVSNTGYSMVGIAKINDKYIAFDATNVSKTGTSSDHYTQGRLARARATIELLDTCKAILEGGSASGSYSYLEKGAAAIVENPITPYCVINAAQNIEFLYTYNGDDLFQPASTSKLVGGLAILSVLSNLEEYHSIWDDNKELLNDSGSDATSQETHVAYAGDVESVRTSLYTMMLVSNGANTLSLARMAGEKIIQSKNRFLNLTLDE